MLRRILPLAAGFAFAPGAVLAQRSIHTFIGAATGDKFGYSIGASDVDADGRPDLIVGAPFADNNGDKSGTAKVYSGLNGNVLFARDGHAGADEFGYSVDGAGDVDGDGYGDFIVGSIGHYDGQGPYNGRAFVYSGRTRGEIYAFANDRAYDYFALSVGGAGDVDGDGYDDLIVGIPGRDDHGSASGQARIYSGGTGAILYTFDGDAASDEFGWWVRGAGDVDGDGHADVIVGAPGAAGGFRPGYARVFSGRTGATLHTFRGTSGGDRFGWCVDGAGDFDADGRDDLIVGAFHDDGNGVEAGAARVFSGASGALLLALGGSSAGDQFGWSVAGAGDVDADGYADVIVGARFDDDGGNDAGSMRVYSGPGGSVIGAMDGASADDQFGFAVDAAGDVDDDGYDDVIVGAVLEAENGTARVLSFGGTRPQARNHFIGSGCAGSNGHLPRIDVRGRAALGESYTALLRGGIANTSALLNIGIRWGLSLDPGAPGCTAHAYPLISYGVITNATGLASVVPGICPIPRQRDLIGVELSNQWLLLDPSSNALGISSSNAARLTIGN